MEDALENIQCGIVASCHCQCCQFDIGIGIGYLHIGNNSILNPTPRQFKADCPARIHARPIRAILAGRFHVGKGLLLCFANGGMTFHTKAQICRCVAALRR